MKLTVRLLLAIFLVFGLSMALNIWILRATVTPSFAQLETDHALEDAQRVVEAIRREGEHLEISAQDWAFWSATHTFAQGTNPDYVEENLNADALRSLQYNALYILDEQHRVLWSLDLDLESEEPFEIAALPKDRFPADHPLLAKVPEDQAFSGLMETERGLMLVSVAPILTNEQEGPAAGILIFGRHLDEAVVAGLRSQTGVAFALVSLSSETLSDADRTGLDALSKGSSFDIAATSDEMLTVRSLLRDIEGAPLALMRIGIPRDITQIGAETEQTALILLFVAGILVLLSIGVLAQTIIIAPIKALTRHITTIGKTGRLSEVEEIKRDDEIGLLAREFDAMVRQLVSTREQLMEQSYYSGKADSTAGVLHNLRNALNPINMTLWRVTRALKERDSGHEKRAVEELSDTSTPQERRAKLWLFLQRAVGRSDDERQQLLKDLHEVADQHRSIEDILSVHDTFARYEQPLGYVDLAGVFDEAARVISPDQGPKVKIAWPPSPPPARAHRVVLGQVLGNLFVNAVEAIAAAGMEEGAISVTCDREEGPEGAMVHLAVTDNGEGIAEDRLAMVFERGYSSRPQKSGGLGLHWCANSLAGMGGRIEATSEGPGKGAVFHIYLPVAEDAATEAAE